jgi:hypothetical protein
MTSNYGALVKRERAELFSQLVVKLTGCEVRPPDANRPQRVPAVWGMDPAPFRTPSRMGRRTLHTKGARERCEEGFQDCSRRAVLLCAQRVRGAGWDHGSCVQPPDDNFAIAAEYCQYHTQYHKYLDSTPSTVRQIYAQCVAALPPHLPPAHLPHRPPPSTYSDPRGRRQGGCDGCGAP